MLEQLEKLCRKNRWGYTLEWFAADPSRDTTEFCNLSIHDEAAGRGGRLLFNTSAKGTATVLRRGMRWFQEGCRPLHRDKRAA